MESGKGLVTLGDACHRSNLVAREKRTQQGEGEGRYRAWKARQGETQSPRGGVGFP